MRKKVNLKRMVAAGLAVSMLTGGGTIAGPIKAQASEGNDNWNQIEEVVGRYYGEWTDTTYPGQISSLTPDTALMGNGDIGVNSGGNATEKTFYISKGDFWEYNGTQKAVGGYTIHESVEDSLNYAFKRPVEASSIWDGTTASILVDGDASTVWTTSAHNHNQDHWAIVDLGDAKEIGYWVVKNIPGSQEVYTSDFKLQYSNDKEKWTDFAEVTGNSEEIVKGILEKPVSARYVRIYITKGEQNGNLYARVAELELYEKEMEEENFAPQYKNVTVTNEDTWGLPNLGKDLAVSGKFQPDEQGYGWCSKPIQNNEPQWMMVEFNEPMTLKQYRLFSDGASREIAKECNSYDFQLQYSNDGQTWGVADDVKGNTESIYNKVLDDAVVAKYFRVYITNPVQPEYDTNQDIRAKIAQLELYSSVKEFEEPDVPEEFYEKQDILNAQVNTEMSFSKIPVSMETFTSATENVVITELTSKGEKPIKLSVDTWVKADDQSRPAEVLEKEGMTTLTRSTYNSNPGDSNSHTSKVALTTKVIGAESEAETGSDRGILQFTVEPQTTVYLVTTVGGGGQNYDNNGKLLSEDPVEESRNLLNEYSDVDAVKELKQEHNEWWKNYWSASYIDFGTEDEQLNSAQKYYYGAQYILGCTVRDGKTAPGIMGIWCNTDNPKWSNHYQLNYNHNSTYYGFGSSNRPEFNKPAFDVILDYKEQGQKNAESISELQKLDWVDAYWVQPGGDTLYIDKRIEDGTLDPQKGIEGGLLYPAGIIPFGQSACSGLYHNQTANATYSALAGVEYYKYTMDKEYLRDYLYDYLKACAAFYDQWLEYDEETGQYNVYAGFHEQSWGYNPTIELLTIDFLYETLVEASETLGVDADKREKWIDIRDHLAPITTAELNGKNVIAFAEKKWEGGETYEFNPSVLVKTDGNVTQLDGICLDGSIGYFSEPEMLENVRNTLSVSEQSWLHGNHFTRTYPIAVRTRYDIQTIIDRFVTMINTNMQSNLRIKDEYHGVEKCGDTMAINEMLLISDEGITKIFPNWYADKDAKFANLRAKGAFTVSAEYDGTAHEAKNVTVTSEAGEDMTLVSPWTEGMTVKDSKRNIVETTKGTVPNWEDKENATYTFATTAGETYTVEKGETEPEKPSKNTLEYFLNEAKECEANGDVDSCVESVKKLFEEAITEGDAVMADEDATYDEIQKATVKLMKAIQALDMKAADKTDLQMAVDLANGIDLSRYVEAGQAEFTQALKAAQAVLADSDAMQEGTDAAWDALVTAMSNLRLKADKSTLEDLLNSVKDLDLSQYTEESAAVFRSALAKAQAVLTDESLSEDDQKTVDTAVKALSDAKEQLQSKDNSTGNMDDNNGTDNIGNGNKDTGDSGTLNAGDTADVPKTGDTETPFMMLWLAGMAAGTLVFLRKRSK